MNRVGVEGNRGEETEVKGMWQYIRAKFRK